MKKNLAMFLSMLGLLLGASHSFAKNDVVPADQIRIKVRKGQIEVLPGQGVTATRAGIENMMLTVYQSSAGASLGALTVVPEKGTYVFSGTGPRGNGPGIHQNHVLMVSDKGKLRYTITEDQAKMTLKRDPIWNRLPLFRGVKARLAQWQMNRALKNQMK